MSMTKRTKTLLVVAILLILVGSIMASLFNTSFGSVKVTEINFETEYGHLDGYLYMPKGAGADDPRPVIITTHGYLNSKENQDSNSIEMARRGYIVLDLDMYDHGDSTWEERMELGNWMNWYNPFWLNSMYDAAEYIFEQPYTLKDADGNAYVAVSGHSMGGFCSLLATYYDELNSLSTGKRMIYTCLSVGADYTYSSWYVSQEQSQAGFGSRTIGMICAQHDEFFFNKSNAEKTAEELAWKCTVLTADTVGTVSYKDYVSTASGKQFLGLDTAGASGETGKYYTVESGELLDANGKVIRESQTGSHIVYEPNSTHAFCYFSTKSVGYAISFYNDVFKDILPASMTNAGLSAGNQIWIYKALFNLVALVGFFMLFFPLVDILLKVPALSGAKTQETARIGARSGGKAEAGFWIIIAGLTAVVALTYTTLMDRSEPGMTILRWVFGALLAFSAVAAVVSAVRKNKDKLKCFATVAVLSLIELLHLVLSLKVLQMGKVWKQPQTNEVAYWAFFNAVMVAIVLVLAYYLLKKPAGAKFEDYGIVLKAKPILSSLGIAVIVIAAGMAVLFAVEAVLKVDFRFWALVTVKTFGWRALEQSAVYLPFFFAYYFVCAASMKANVIGRRHEVLMSLIVNLGGMVVWLALQYGFLFGAGKGIFTGAALNTGILLGMVFGFGVATVCSLKMYKKTNNVWLSAIFNALLITITTCANTATFWMYGA